MESRWSLALKAEPLIIGGEFEETRQSSTRIFPRCSGREHLCSNGAICIAGAFGLSTTLPGNIDGDWQHLFPVGSRSLGIYLISTSEGDILINAGLEDSVPMIQHSVEKLGFRFADIKILLISHAHFDHDAGAARIKQATGANYEVMDWDVPAVESGGRKDFFYENAPEMLYAPANVDRVLHDGDTVELGDTVLTAHLTPGHTKGCTTWTMKVEDGGRVYDVVIVGSPNVNPGYMLVNNTAVSADRQRL